MNRLWIVGASAVALLGLGSQLQGLRERLDQVEGRAVVRPDEFASLAREVEGVRREAADARLRAEDTSREDELAARLEDMRSKNQSSSREIDSISQRMASLESTWDGHEPADLESRIAGLRAELESRTAELDAMAQEAALLAREDQDRLSDLRSRVEPLTRARDVDGMWNELVGPVVQLAGDVTVGSGVLLESRRREEGGYLTYLITSWHVVRDIYGSTDRTSMPVPVKIYLPEGGLRQESAHLVAYDVPLDVALLTLDCTEPVPCGARLASRERVHAVSIFESIYAVGCPLGNDPIPTPGEIAATQHEVEGGLYWMISAPTYIGNSGGGIFDAKTHDLLAIFSKIYTHGSMRATIVPHMGLATPLSIVYDWLDSIGQSQVVDAQGPRTLQGSVQTASARKH